MDVTDPLYSSIYLIQQNLNAPTGKSPNKKKNSLLAISGVFNLRQLFIFVLFLSGLILSQSYLQAKTLPGIDNLRATQFKILQNKKVGLLTHPAGVDSHGISTVEILHHSKKVNLVALFGPEHGIYGNEKANDPVDNLIDPKTQLPVYSLYGKYRTPTKKMLAGLDVMVIDLQDIGVRSYTYVSCMRLAMEACFRNGVEVVVLDRPNPLGGLKVDGPIMEKQLRSYVGAFMVPYVHGLTIGELAKIAKLTPEWLDISEDTRKQGKLRIVPMKNWTRNMTWNQTGLEWIPTSPSIPTLSAVLGYAMTGLGAEINGFRHGFGTEYPFRLLNHRDVPVDVLLKELQALDLPGLAFTKTIGTNSKENKIEGVYVQVTNWNQLSPLELSFVMMPLACQLEGKNPYQSASNNSVNLFNKHVGSMPWWEEISTKGVSADVKTFLKQWSVESIRFQTWTSQYWIYK